MATSQLLAEDVFSYLRPEQINAIHNVSEIIERRSGEVVYIQGEKAKSFYVVLDGEVALRLPGKKGLSLLIESLGRGAIFVPVGPGAWHLASGLTGSSRGTPTGFRDVHQRARGPDDSFGTFGPGPRRAGSARCPEMVGVDGGGVVFEVLDDSHCRALLDRAGVGRVGISAIHALPVVLPVNYAVLENSIIFRSTPGTKVSAGLMNAVVAFEVDEYESNGDVGWSVLVQGMATQITDPEEIAVAKGLPLRFISAGGDADRFVRIEMATITGRRVRPSIHRPRVAASPPRLLESPRTSDRIA